MKKKKPYGTTGRTLSSPPAKQQDLSKPQWMWVPERLRYISFYGWVCWHSQRATWYGYLSKLNRCYDHPHQPYNGFDNPKQAMAWVEKEHKRRERKRTWLSTEP